MLKQQDTNLVKSNQVLKFLNNKKKWNRSCIIHRNRCISVLDVIRLVGLKLIVICLI